MTEIYTRNPPAALLALRHVAEGHADHVRRHLLPFCVLVELTGRVHLEVNQLAAGQSNNHLQKKKYRITKP